MSSIIDQSKKLSIQVILVNNNLEECIPYIRNKGYMKSFLEDYITVGRYNKDLYTLYMFYTSIFKEENP